MVSKVEQIIQLIGVYSNNKNLGEIKSQVHKLGVGDLIYEISEEESFSMDDNKSNDSEIDIENNINCNDMVHLQYYYSSESDIEYEDSFLKLQGLKDSENILLLLNESFFGDKLILNKENEYCKEYGVLKARLTKLIDNFIKLKETTYCSIKKKHFEKIVNFLKVTYRLIDDLCGICLQHYSICFNNHRLLPCNHIYCKDCIIELYHNYLMEKEKWLLNKDLIEPKLQCPKCKFGFRLKSKNYEWIPYGLK